MSNAVLKLCPVRSNILYPNDNRRLFKCQSCDFIFLRPFPDHEKTESNYLTECYDNEERYHQFTKATRQMWHQRIDTIEKYFFNNNKYDHNKTIIDLGFATGFFLQIVQQMGWDVFGIEHSNYTADQASIRFGDNRVYRVPFQEFKYLKKFSVLLAWDVIEYVSDPLSFTKKTNLLLRGGGIFALSTVNTASLTRRLYPDKRRYFIPPKHLSYFNISYLSEALKETIFELLEVKTKFVYKPPLDRIRPYAFPYFPHCWKNSHYSPKKVFKMDNQGDTIEAWTRKIS